MANTTFPDPAPVCECGHDDVTHWRYTGECMASTETETWACGCHTFVPAKADADA